MRDAAVTVEGAYGPAPLRERIPMTPKPLILNLFEMNCVGHISHGLWVHTDNTRHRFNDLDFWTAEARLLEEGLFDAVFLADVIGAYDGYRSGPETALREAVQIPSNDPLLVVPAMAAVTGVHARCGTLR